LDGNNLKSYNAASNEIIRVGTDGADVGLFLYNTTGTQLAKYTGTGLTINSGGDITVASGGDINLDDGGDIVFLNTARDWYINSKDDSGSSDLAIYPNEDGSSYLLLGKNFAGTYHCTGVEVVAIDVINFRLGQTDVGFDATIVFNQNYLAPNESAGGAIDLGTTGSPWNDLFIKGESQFGGGYGSTGCTIEADGDIKTNGIIYSGTDNTEIGKMYLYGDATGGHEGGQIRLYIDADHDSTHNYWTLFAYDTKLHIQTDAADDIFLFTAAGDIDCAGFVDAAAGFKDNGTAGIDGSFTDNDGNTITVSGGIITALT